MLQGSVIHILQAGDAKFDLDMDRSAIQCCDPQLVLRSDSEVSDVVCESKRSRSLPCLFYSQVRTTTPDGFRQSQARISVVLSIIDSRVVVRRGRQTLGNRNNLLVRADNGSQRRFSVHCQNYACDFRRAEFAYRSAQPDRYDVRATEKHRVQRVFMQHRERVSYLFGSKDTTFRPRTTSLSRSSTNIDSKRLGGRF